MHAGTAYHPNQRCVGERHQEGGADVAEQAGQPVERQAFTLRAGEQAIMRAKTVVKVKDGLDQGPAERQRDKLEADRLPAPCRQSHINRRDQKQERE